jgi:hypothetical protein
MSSGEGKRRAVLDYPILTRLSLGHSRLYLDDDYGQGDISVEQLV